MRTFLAPLLAVLLLGTSTIAATLDFALIDHESVLRRLSDYSNKRIVVLTFLGVDCPLAKLYAARLNELATRYQDAGVAFLGVNSNADDSPETISQFAAEHHVPFPILCDPDQRIADLLGASRQLEVFVLDERREIRYHGRVDDQYGPGTRRPAPLRDDLAIALDELLSEQAVSVAQTPLAGCLLDRRELPNAKVGACDTISDEPVTYHRQIKPLLAKHCVDCHRPGQIGPFSLTSYAAAAAWADTIRERVAANKMPPWHADPQYGHFANERRLSDADKQLLFSWIDYGRAEGVDDSDSHLATSTTYPSDAEVWRIGQPEKIVTMPTPVKVPAQGTVDYKIIEIDPGFTKDTWIRGAEVRPGHRGVVHHVTVFLAPAGQERMPEDAIQDIVFFAAYVPGLAPTLLPPGMARKIPAGWHIYFQMHYVPNGIETTDQTSLGLRFADEVRSQVGTSLLLIDNFSLRPYADDQQLEQTWSTPADILLLSMMPHMHLRGKSFRYEAIYPDGRQETLLNVPHFDLMWQHQYVLAEPKLLPAGTVLRGVGVYDNSAANPNNPDPSATVRCGPQTTDEMFNGWFTYAEAENASRRKFPWLALSGATAAAAWIVERRRIRRGRADSTTDKGRTHAGPLPE